MKIDLRNCKKGDILISSLGAKLQYIGAIDKNHPYNHRVKYLEGGVGGGTRTDDGKVYQNTGNPNIDHDIVEIIPK